jgi:membrane associated rhomboid family serine protease
VIPLKDRNPTSRRPILTVLFIVACVWIFFVVQPEGQRSFVRSPEADLEATVWTVEHAAIPCEVLRGRPLGLDEFRSLLSGVDASCRNGPAGPELAPDKNVYLAVLYSMFLHGGLLHLAGNMLFLWVFGNNIEDRMGRFGYAAFYLLGGIVATMAHVLANADSVVPLVGASGAIAAVMGSYLVLFPWRPVLSVVPIFFFGFLTEVPAGLLLGLWFVTQFFLPTNSGVAWMAHVAGFVFGVVVTVVLRSRLLARRTPSYVERRWR